MREWECESGKRRGSSIMVERLTMRGLVRKCGGESGEGA